jgi:glycosyltransferase involved in cell wall biosynthesis
MTGATKVLFVSHSAAMGGAEMCLCNQLRFLDRKRWAPLVVLPEDGVLRERLAALGVRTTIIPVEWWVPGEIWHCDYHYYTVLARMQGNLDAVKRTIESEGIDIVQTNSVVTIDGALAAAVTGRPHVWHVTENLLSTESLKPYLSVESTFRLVDLLSDVVVAVSPFLGERLGPFVSAEKLQVITGGIPVEDYLGTNANEDHPVRAAIGCSRDELVVGVLGSITRRKNPEGFVEIAARVLAIRGNARFVWIGNPTERAVASAATAKARQLGVADRVTFLGFQESAVAALRDLDVVIHPSFNENLSLACIEAMATGRPVVTTRSGGPDEIVVDGESGYLVPVDKPEEMVERIVELLDDAELRAAMGARAKARAIERFDAAGASRQYERLYERLLARPRQPSAAAAALIPPLVELLSRTGTMGFDLNCRPLPELLRKILRHRWDAIKRRLAARRSLSGQR